MLEVQRKPGVMDPVEASVLKGASDLGVTCKGCALAVASRLQQGCRLRRIGLEIPPTAIEDVAVDPSESLRYPEPGAASSMAVLK